MDKARRMGKVSAMFTVRRLGHSHKDATISVRGDTYDRLEAEAKRLGIPVAQLVEGLIGDPVTWQDTAERIRKAA